MSLDEYWRKRDFEHTPEPRGARPDPSRRPLRRFVVQRHRATRLHYDFRLEVAGVLVSWAVPRGPSMRPLEKRRAARTEDHPLEYLDFEGVIPVGEYGGGDVIVWDQGLWEPESLDDPATSVEDGELKFVLHGRRLRGRFVLVRTRQEHQSRQDWLLIHKDDDEAEADWDIEAEPTSVLSGRTNDEVAAGGRTPTETPVAQSLADIDLSAAVEAPRPTFVKPMLATAVDRPFSDEAWLYELKLDGYRVQAVVDGHAVKLWTRNRKDAAGYFPAFAASPPDWITPHAAIVDGEMVALDRDGRPSFSLLQDLSGLRGLAATRGERRTGEDPRPPPSGTLVYHAFDLLHLDDWDLTLVPLEERKRLLQLVLREHPSVRYVSHVLAHGEDFQAAVVKQGLEGSVAKLRHSRYEPGQRSRAWLKIKARREQELVVVGYEPGQGSHRDLGSLLVATHEDGAFRFAGQVGSGIDGKTRTLLRQILDEHPLDEPPVVDPPRLEAARWSEPRQVIRARFTEWTSDGLLRHASYQARELGRDPASVSREVVAPVDERAPAEPDDAASSGPSRARRPARATSQPGPVAAAADAPPTGDPTSLVRGADEVGSPAVAVTADELAALDEIAKAGRWAVGGHEVSLTNLDKVLFPDVGYTKRDLVRYFVTIAPVMLPYLRERPLNVHRWPDGVAGKTNFWQKQIPSHAPEWVARWDYPEAGREQSHTYVVADRVATMAWLANQAVIDLHPWTSRLPDYWRPTYAYIDIDPGEQTTWPQLLTLARLYRTALDHLGVQAVPKVTGKRGIQIWINILPRYTFDDTRDWVGHLSRGVGKVVPELVSWEWGKRDRGGRARLDYTQNSLIKTLVAPYAVRPVPTASVSMPISWDELDDPDLTPGRWDLRSAVARVEAVGDRFAGVLSDPQELPPLT
jgi:bifunctional non-homologous end joining protein LigD